MNNFFHRLFNPHCPECREELREKAINPVEEALKLENARMQEMIDRLFDRLLEKPEAVVEEPRPASVAKPTFVPWRVRQQMLQDQDRVTAKLMREAPKPDAKTTEDIKNLEVDLGVEETKEQVAS